MRAAESYTSSAIGLIARLSVPVRRGRLHESVPGVSRKAQEPRVSLFSRYSILPADDRAILKHCLNRRVLSIDRSDSSRQQDEIGAQTGRIEPNSSSRPSARAALNVAILSTSSGREK